MGIEAALGGNAERQTEMKRADVPPPLPSSPLIEGSVRKENRRGSDHALQRKEDIFWGRGRLSVAFPLKWKWSTERRGTTLSTLAATAMNDAATCS